MWGPVGLFVNSLRSNIQKGPPLRAIQKDGVSKPGTKLPGHGKVSCFLGAKSKQKARCPARYKRRFKRVFLQLALRAQTNKNTFPFKPPFIGNGENGQGKKVLLGISFKTKTPVPFKRGGCFKSLSGILIQLALLLQSNRAHRAARLALHKLPSSLCSYRAIALIGQLGLLCISCPARFCSYRAIALTGQVPAQAPHSTHLVSSMCLLPSCSLIAPTGQADSQAPQLMQTSGFTL